MDIGTLTTMQSFDCFAKGESEERRFIKYIDEEVLPNYPYVVKYYKQALKNLKRGDKELSMLTSKYKMNPFYYKEASFKINPYKDAKLADFRVRYQICVHRLELTREMMSLYENLQLLSGLYKECQKAGRTEREMIPLRDKSIRLHSETKHIYTARIQESKSELLDLVRYHSEQLKNFQSLQIYHIKKKSSVWHRVKNLPRLVILEVTSRIC